MATIVMEKKMNSHSMRELRTTPKAIWNDLSSSGKVVLTNKGKPTALLLDISDGSFEDTVKAVRQIKAINAFTSMRNKAAAMGFMSEEEIEAEIAAAKRGL